MTGLVKIVCWWKGSGVVMVVVVMVLLAVVSVLLHWVEYEEEEDDDEFAIGNNLKLIASFCFNCCWYCAIKVSWSIDKADASNRLFRNASFVAVVCWLATAAKANLCSKYEFIAGLATKMTLWSVDPKLSPARKSLSWLEQINQFYSNLKAIQTKVFFICFLLIASFRLYHRLTIIDVVHFE